MLLRHLHCLLAAGCLALRAETGRTINMQLEYHGHQCRCFVVHTTCLECSGSRLRAAAHK